MGQAEYPAGIGEIPMSSVSSRTPVDFLFRIWGMRSS